MSINGKDHGVLGAPLVASHAAEEAAHKRTVGCIALAACVVLGAIVSVLCCGGAVLVWRLM